MKINVNHRLVSLNNAAVPFVASPNVGGAYPAGKPDFLILHYTAGDTAQGAISWFKNPNAKASAHLVIGHTGDITQMVPFDRIAWHAGKSNFEGIIGLNSRSVGIEIANWGLLRGQAGQWRSWTGAAVPDSRVLIARHKNFEPDTPHGWEVYDDAQWNAVFDAAAALVHHYGIPESHVLGHEDIAPGRKQDPGPAFDLNRFRARLFGRADNDDDVFVVNSPTGLNLRTAANPQASVIVLLKDRQRVRRIAVNDVWFQIVTLDAAGHEDKLGWAHSRWLKPV